MTVQRSSETAIKDIKYEIDSLNESYKMILRIETLLTGLIASATEKWILKMAIMDNFALHARCLIEFFEKSGPNSAHSLCNHYKGRFPPDKFGRTLNGQVAHLLYERIADDRQKISDAERLEFMEWIADSLKDFKAKLNSGSILAELPDVTAHLAVGKGERSGNSAPAYGIGGPTGSAPPSRSPQ